MEIEENHENKEKPKTIKNLDEYISFRSPSKKQSPKNLLNRFSIKTKNVSIPEKDSIKFERFSSLSKKLPKDNNPLKRMSEDEILGRIKSKEDINYILTQYDKNTDERSNNDKEYKIDSDKKHEIIGLTTFNNDEEYKTSSDEEYETNNDFLKSIIPDTPISDEEYETISDEEYETSSDEEYTSSDEEYTSSDEEYETSSDEEYETSSDEDDEIDEEYEIVDTYEFSRDGQRRSLYHKNNDEGKLNYPEEEYYEEQIYDEYPSTDKNNESEDMDYIIDNVGVVSLIPSNYKDKYSSNNLERIEYDNDYILIEEIDEDDEIEKDEIDDYIMVEEDESDEEDDMDDVNNVCEMKSLGESLFKNRGLLTLYSDEDLKPCVEIFSKKYLSLSPKHKVIFVADTIDDVNYFECFSRKDEMCQRYNIMTFNQFIERFMYKVFPDNVFLIIQNGLYFSSDVYDNDLRVLPSEIGIYCAKKAKKVLIFTKELFENGIGDIINMVSMARGVDPITRTDFVTEYNLNRKRFIRRYFRCIFYISESYLKQLEYYKKHINIKIIPFILDDKKHKNEELLVERKKIDYVCDMILYDRKNLIIIDKTTTKMEKYLKFKLESENLRYKIVTNVKKKDKIISRFNNDKYDVLVMNIHTPLDVSKLNNLDNIYILDSSSNLNKKITLIDRIKTKNVLNIIHFVHSNFCKDMRCEMSKDEKNILKFLNKIRGIHIRDGLRNESIKYSINVGTGCDNHSFWSDIFENTFKLIF